MEEVVPATKEDLYHAQMGIKQVQAVQSNHSDRILCLERKLADDAALKSVWNSPFPSVLNGTPQQDTGTEEVFDDFDDEHGQNLLGSLHLDAEEEPVKRGASRANSVRFDISAIQGPSWGHASRSSGDFGPISPGSGFSGLPMERSLSHKSDGRQSSTGQSIHSLHSAPSGRTSSLGLTSNFPLGPQDDTPSTFDVPEPPPGLFVLGSVPSIIRCWLSEQFSHDSLLYAAVCTGSRRSTIDHALVKELGFLNRIQKDAAGISTVKLVVYLPEAVVTQSMSRSSSPTPQLPSLTVDFEVTGIDQQPVSNRAKAIQVIFGSDILRMHSADILLSQNIMALYGDDRNRLSVPFVRPEDDGVFKNLYTTNIARDKVGRLNGTAAPFTPAAQKMRVDSSSQSQDNKLSSSASDVDAGRDQPDTSAAQVETPPRKSLHQKASLSGTHIPDQTIASNSSTSNLGSSDAGSGTRGEIPNSKVTDTKPIGNEAAGHRESIGGIWGSWRNAPGNGDESSKDNATTSSYTKPARGGRSMKVLRPSSKTTQSNRSSSNPRPANSALEDTQPRNRSQVSLADSNSSLRWEPKRSMSDNKLHKDIRPIANVSRSSNPVGGASAFSWMKPSNAKTNVTSGS